MPRPKPDNIERIFVGASISKAMIKKLKEIALHEERPLYNVIEEAIEQYLNNRSKKGGVK